LEKVKKKVKKRVKETGRSRVKRWWRRRRSKDEGVYEKKAFEDSGNMGGGEIKRHREERAQG